MDSCAINNRSVVLKKKTSFFFDPLPSSFLCCHGIRSAAVTKNRRSFTLKKKKKKPPKKKIWWGGLVDGLGKHSPMPAGVWSGMRNWFVAIGGGGIRSTPYTAGWFRLSNPSPLLSIVRTPSSRLQQQIPTTTKIETLLYTISSFSVALTYWKFKRNGSQIDTPSSSSSCHYSPTWDPLFPIPPPPRSHPWPQTTSIRFK